MIQRSLLSPDVLDAPPVTPGLVAVPFGSIITFRRQTLVHVTLDIVAVAKSFVEKPTGVTFIEGGHDLLAV